jgi:uncharacterized membrane protein
MKKTKYYSLIILLLFLVIAFYSYPLMPDQIATHWDSQGNVDGYMSKLWGSLFFPILMIVINIMFFIVPKIDPNKENIEKFKESFNEFIIIFNLFMLYIYSLTVVWNMGREFNMNVAIIPALGFLFYFIGSLIGKAKRNYMIGIRLPWTLASDDNWDKTHRKGERVFKIIGIVTLIGVFFSDYAMWFLLIPLIIGITYLTLYSYLEFKKA